MKSANDTLQVVEKLILQYLINLNRNPIDTIALDIYWIVYTIYNILIYKYSVFIVLNINNIECSLQRIKFWKLIFKKGTKCCLCDLFNMHYF